MAGNYYDYRLFYPVKLKSYLWHGNFLDTLIY